MGGGAWLHTSQIEALLMVRLIHAHAVAMSRSTRDNRSLASRCDLLLRALQLTYGRPSLRQQHSQQQQRQGNPTNHA
jgi:hypothetical protein